MYCIGYYKIWPCTLCIIIYIYIFRFKGFSALMDPRLNNPLNWAFTVYEIFKAVKIWIVVFWVVTACSFVGGYQCLRNTLPSSCTLKRVTTCSSKTSVTNYKTVWRHNWEDRNPQNCVCSSSSELGLKIKTVKN